MSLGFWQYRQVIQATLRILRHRFQQHLEGCQPALYGVPIEEIRRSHTQAVDEWDVFGVPTFVVDGRAVFVRLMSRPRGDAELARRTIEGVVRLFDEQPDLNEFKYTKLSR